MDQLAKDKIQLKENIGLRSLYTEMDLHPSERKLIETIRALGDGEIEVLKIQNSLPVIYKILLGTGSFVD